MRIGLAVRRAGGPGKLVFGAKDVVYFQPVRLKSRQQTVTVTVDKPPKYAGVHPDNKQIDRNSDDNAIKVTS